MRFYYDTEFIENGTTIDLVSIGIVAQDGRELYAVSSAFSVNALHDNPWLVENVRPSLPGSTCTNCRCITGWHLDRDHPDVRSRAQLARMVRDFLLTGPTAPELWADYGAYDHVALCQLWGRMIDLPDGIPMFTHDLRQEIEKTPAVEPIPEQAQGLHNALADARHARELGRWLGHDGPIVADKGGPDDKVKDSEHKDTGTLRKFTSDGPHLGGRTTIEASGGGNFEIGPVPIVDEHLVTARARNHLHRRFGFTAR